MKIVAITFAHVLCLLTFQAQAQQELLSVRSLALDPAELPELHLMGQSGHLPLEFSSVQPGEPIIVVDANPLPIYQRGTDEAGTETWTITARVNIPTGAKGILLLGWRSGEATRYIAVEDNFSNARFDDWLLINASNKPVAFAVGENARPVAIRPGSSIRQRFNVRHGEGTAVTALTPVEDKPTIFYSTYWPVRQDSRSVVLFAGDGDRILVRRISDRLAR